MLNDRSIFILEPAINGLDVCEDALPVRFSHHYHVFYVEKRSNAGVIPVNTEIIVKVGKKKKPLPSCSNTYSATLNASSKFLRRSLGVSES